MTEQQIPSQDPADTLTLAGGLRAVFNKLMQGTDVQLPAKVLSYDRVNNVATVQPLIALLTTSGETVSKPSIARVPVVALGCSGFAINFPLKADDLGWIMACDRDISIYMQSLRESSPNTLRLHSFEDAVFVPDAMSKFDASAVASNAMTIQSADGSVRVELSPTEVKIVAPTVTVQASTVTVTGATTFNNHVDMPAGARIGGIEFATHKHLGVTTGGGTSGGPTA